MKTSDYCVLVAEDDEIVRYTIRKTLSKEGYTVLEAADGQAALRTEAAYDGAIHLLITNVSMPKMDGHDLARAIRLKRPDIQVIIVSGINESDFPPEAKHHAEALLKPVTPELLLSTVRRLLRRNALSPN